MEPEITTSVGIVVERRESTNRWADHLWTPLAAIPDAPPTDGWQVLQKGDGIVQYHYAPIPVTLHRKLGEAYDANVETEAPSLWIMLDEADTDPVPYTVRGVTADPFEAMGMLDAGEGIVERVSMPAELVRWMAGYLKQLPEPEKFRKRKRTSAKEDAPQFGKEPIFTRQRRGPEEKDA